MFSGLNIADKLSKLGDSVRELESALTTPASPPTSRRRPTTPQSATSTSSRPSMEASTAPTSADSGSPTVGTGVVPTTAAAQSASQLADQALSSLRMSFRKGRASADGVAQARSLGLQRTASNSSVKSGQSGSDAGEPVVVIVTPSEAPLVAKVIDSPAVAEEAVGVISLGEAKEGTEKLDTSSKPSTTSPEINRAPSPDLRFAISTATATPEDSITRVATPLPAEPTKFLEIPLLTPATTLTTENASNGNASSSETSLEDPVLTVKSISPTTTTTDTVGPATTFAPSTSATTSEDATIPGNAPAAIPALLSSETGAEVPITPPLSKEESPAVPPVKIPKTHISEPLVQASAPQPIKSETGPTTTSKVLSDVADEEGAVATPSSKDPRIAEITQAYKRLQKLKSSLDKIVMEITPLAGVSDVDAFEGELRNMKLKTDMSMAEVRRLADQLAEQQARLENLQSSHLEETKAKTESIETLQVQLSEKDAALKLLNDQLSQAEEGAKLSAAAVEKGVEDYDKLKIVAKEEEEKRIKALSLLRALRQKLVKSEKDREEGDKEREALRVADVATQETIKADKLRFESEIVSLRAAQELQLTKLRQAFERETNSIRTQHERESTAKRGQTELDVITAKATHSKELSTKDTRIQQLEGKVREMTTSRDTLFDQLQVRTAEMESSSSHQESLEGQTGELQYDLKEARDRVAALREEIEELKRARRDVTRDDANTRRLLGEAETRHEGKIRELATRAKQLEKERQETEEEMGKNLQDRMREVERMRQQISQKDLDYAEAMRSRGVRDEKIEETEAKTRELMNKLSAAEALAEHHSSEATTATRAEAAVREELRDRAERSSELETRLEEIQAKESTLRSNNKILRDELRKLQSGVLLSEKQRNPGVGFFSTPSRSYSVSGPSGTPLSPTSSELGRESRSESVSSLSGPGSVEKLSDGMGVASINGEEALNFEYIRNVILQFLERPEMRTHLVSVLGVILHFTPAETRRLASKSAVA